MFIILLLTNSLIYADNQRTIHRLEGKISGVEQRLDGIRVSKYTNDENESLKTILERLDNLESRQAVTDGDMNMVKLQQKLWAEDWKSIFSPMQKEYVKKSR
jgi:ribosomal protein L11 methylase PrmA